MATTPSTTSEPVTFTDVKTYSGGGGTNSYEVTLNLLFWNEMQRLTDYFSPPEFDGGYIQEIISGGKCKVKLQGKGTVVTATSGTNVRKGWYALVLCTPSDSSSPNATYSYSIVAQKDIAAMTVETSEYPV